MQQFLQATNPIIRAPQFQPVNLDMNMIQSMMASFQPQKPQQPCNALDNKDRYNVYFKIVQDLLIKSFEHKCDPKVN